MSVDLESESRPSIKNNFTNREISRQRQISAQLETEELISSEVESLISINEMFEDAGEEITGPVLEKIEYLNIRKSIYGCSKCELRNSCYLPVPFEFNRPENRNFSVIALNGAPGRSEDADNGFFSDRHQNTILTRATKAVDLQVDGYVNVCCCRPPNDRDPLAEERKACRKNLVSQIKLMDPWLIICFGATAIKALRPDFKITVDHGCIFPSSWPEISKDKVIWAVGVYHPSFVLRHRGDDQMCQAIKNDFVEDLKHISSVVQCRDIFGADVVHALMTHARVGAPYIKGDNKKTEELRQTYLQRMEDIRREAEEAKGGKVYGV